MSEIKFRFKIETEWTSTNPTADRDELWGKLIDTFNATNRNDGADKQANDVTVKMNSETYFLEKLITFSEIDNKIKVLKLKFTAQLKGGIHGMLSIMHNMQCIAYSKNYIVVGDNFKLIEDNKIQTLCTEENNTIPFVLTYPIQGENGIQVEIIRD